MENVFNYKLFSVIGILEQRRNRMHGVLKSRARPDIARPDNSAPYRQGGNRET